MTKQEFDQKKNAVDVASAQIEAAKASMETSQVNLEYCNIRSPIDGLAGHRLVDAGNVVNAAGMGMGTQLLTIQKMSPMYADFTITEARVDACPAEHVGRFPQGVRAPS